MANLTADSDADTARKRRDLAMRTVGAYSAIQAILRGVQLPQGDATLDRLHDDLARWANKASLRAWELGDD